MGRGLFLAGATPAGTLCRRHASLLLVRSVATAAQLAGHYVSALQEAADALERRGQTRSRAKGTGGLASSCPLCDFVDARSHEVSAMAEPGGADAALCLRHVEVALARRGSVGAGSTASRTAHVESLRALSRELFELHRKSAWDAREEPKGAEQTSWIRAAHYLSYDA